MSRTDSYDPLVREEDIFDGVRSYVQDSEKKYEFYPVDYDIKTIRK